MQREEESRFARNVERMWRCPISLLLSTLRSRSTTMPRSRNTPVRLLLLIFRTSPSLSSDPSGRSRRCTNRSLKRHLLPHISHSSSGSLHLPIIPSPSTLNNPAPLLFLLHSRLPIRSIRLAWRIPPVFLRSPSAFNSLKHTSTPRFDPTVKPIPRGGLEVLDEPERAEFRIEVDGGGIEGM